MFSDGDHAVEHGHDQWRVVKTFAMKQQLGFSNAGENAQQAAASADSTAAPGKISVIGTDHEAGELNAELEASLQKAQRRIERLLGERNQLSALLDKRDAQIQALNRELGPRSIDSDRRVASATAPSFWRRALPSLAAKIGLKAGGHVDINDGTNSAGKQEKTKGETTPHAAFRRSPLVANVNGSLPKAVLAVVIFGLKEDEIRNMLPVIERDCNSSGMMPLLLTDNDAFELLRAGGMIFEYLPPAEDRERFSKELRWDLYVQRRLAIIRQKWQPARVIALGKVAADVLKLWQESPFEESPLPCAAKGT